MDLGGHELRRRHGLDHRRDAAEHRGRRARPDPRPAEGAPAQQGALDPTLGGEEFLTPFRAAARGELDAPFVLVIEGSIPNENINGDGYWTSFGNDEATGEPMTLN